MDACYASPLTEDEIVAASGVARSTFDGWRNGTRRPTLALYEAVANTVGHRVVLVRMEETRFDEDT